MFIDQYTVKLSFTLDLIQNFQISHLHQVM